MEGHEKNVEGIREGLNPVADGTGPLLQRDYWAVIRESRRSPREIMSLVRERFRSFAPEPYVAFRRTRGGDGPLDVGDELEVTIRMAGTTAVWVVHVDSNSLTLATAEGHPEAGRITFGAYPSPHDDPIFHIRSRARSSSGQKYVGFLTAGEPMQTKTWTDFIDHVAHTVGEGVITAIEVETREVEIREDDRKLHSPTFIARGKAE